MAFRNSILAGEQLVRSGIRSENYVTGVSGWRIARDGSAEFSDAVIRGELIVGTLPRIEIVPDYLGLGPSIVFYPASGTDPTIISQIGTNALLTRSPGIGPLDPSFVTVDDAGVSIGMGPGSVLDLVTRNIAFDGILAGVPASTLNGDDFDLFSRLEQDADSPGGNDDANSAAFAAWGPGLTFNQPSWASRAIISVAITGVYGITGASGIELRADLGGLNGATVTVSGIDVANSPRVTYAWHDEISVSGGGTTTLQIEERRIAGAGAIRADTLSVFSATVTWLA